MIKDEEMKVLNLNLRVLSFTNSPKPHKTQGILFMLFVVQALRWNRLELDLDAQVN